ncbi:hypothetical protein [Flavobacterium sp.]|jgi:hypothetical protein|uniref:hypothetical protein n=1 Tax=Flavobacterium sp. TaxID=239 RepID=UPI0037C06FD1
MSTTQPVSSTVTKKTASSSKVSMKTQLESLNNKLNDVQIRCDKQAARISILEDQLRMLRQHQQPLQPSVFENLFGSRPPQVYNPTPFNVHPSISHPHGMTDYGAAFRGFNNPTIQNPFITSIPRTPQVSLLNVIAKQLPFLIGTDSVLMKSGTINIVQPQIQKYLSRVSWYNEIELEWKCVNPDNVCIVSISDQLTNISKIIEDYVRINNAFSVVISLKSPIPTPGFNVPVSSTNDFIQWLVRCNENVITDHFNQIKEAEPAVQSRNEPRQF